MAKIEEKVESLISSTIQNLGYELYDVIYEKEAVDYYLRIFIDKPQGIDLNDCETVNDAITNMLDEANYIKEQYFLEVSSPGIERVLRKEKHFLASLGKEVTINLFKPILIEEKGEQAPSKQKAKKPSTSKQIEGILKEYSSNELVIEIKQNIITIPKKDIANIKLKYNWD